MSLFRYHFTYFVVLLYSAPASHHMHTLCTWIGTYLAKKYPAQEVGVVSSTSIMKPLVLFFNSIRQGIPPGPALSRLAAIFLLYTAYGIDTSVLRTSRR